MAIVRYIKGTAIKRVLHELKMIYKFIAPTILGSKIVVNVKQTRSDLNILPPLHATIITVI